MVKDLRVDEKGDLILDPATHDLETVSGIEEIAQRIRATLIIRYGEMVNLDPEQGSDYSNFLGKNFNATLAADDMSSSILSHVPEVDSVDDITFTKLSRRRLKVDFSCTATPTETNQQENVEGGFEVGT